MTLSGADRRPIKILRVIARLNVGGPARHVIYLTERMNGTGFHTILVKGAESEAEGTMESLARARGVEYVYLAELGREIRAWDDLTAFWKLFRLLRKERPDILHTHTAKAGAVGRLAGLLYRWTTPSGRAMKIFHTFHGHVLRQYFGFWKSLLFRWVERLLARASTRVITLSDALRDELVAFGVAPPERISVVPLGLELEDFLAMGGGKGKNSGPGFRASLGISPEAFLVGSVGRLVPIKDHQTLFQAARLLIEEGEDVHLAVVGDGELRGELERRAREVLPRTRAHFVGWRFDLPFVYNALDAVVLCSLNEGTPVSLIEAMAAARPVVATAVGGVRDLMGGGAYGHPAPGRPGRVEDAERGLLVAPRDPAALAAALRRVREEPQKAADRCRAGRSFVKDRFGVERLVADLSALYQEQVVS
ncbi:MAG: glycosyltransferase [Nitrospinota bacterium]